MKRPPQWTQSELKAKFVDALRSMVRAYGIVVGHDSKKQDYVKTSYDFG